MQFRSLVAVALLSSTSTAAIAAETITYKYDARGRVVEVKRAGTVNNTVQANYSYDKADNRTNVKVINSPNAPPP